MVRVADLFNDFLLKKLQIIRDLGSYFITARDKLDSGAARKFAFP